MGFNLEKRITDLSNRLNSNFSHDADEIFVEIKGIINDLQSQSSPGTDGYCDFSSKLARILLDCHSRAAQSQQLLYYAKMAYFFADESHRINPSSTELKFWLQTAITAGDEYLNHGYLIAGHCFRTASKIALTLRNENSFFYCQAQLAKHYWSTATRSKNNEGFFKYVSKNQSKDLFSNPVLNLTPN